jgi:hypothetical protein
MITVYESIYSSAPHHIEIDKVYEKIKAPKQAEQISIIRELTNKKRQDELKKNLPIVVFGGVFEGARREENWLTSSGRAVLDFDNCNPTEVKEKLKNYQFIEAAFLSPRGNGIKAIAKIPEDKNNYREYYNALLMLFPEADQSTSDPSRACFISYDPDIYLNPEAITFNQRVIKAKFDILQRAVKMIRNAANGERNNTLLKAARLLGGYVSNGQLTEEEAYQTLYEEAMLKDPTEEKEWIRTIENGLKYGKNAPINELVTTTTPTTLYQESKGWRLMPISEYRNEYVRAKLPDPNPITSGFPILDEKMKNKYRGKLCAFIGYGGTKKSMFAQNMGYINAMKGKRVIYSQMEMGAPEQIDRFINMLFMCEGEQMSEWIVKQELNEQGFIDSWYEDRLNKQDADRLLKSDSSGMQASQYREMIEYAMSKWGDVDMLFVDGLSMMGGNPKESETERYSRHTKELKEIANHYNIFVGVVCHVSRGATRHKRDVAYLVRGSEKILDNIDFALNFSLIPDNYAAENITYRQDVGWIRLWDKRGGGGTYDTIYDFDPLRMRMKQSDENPKNYESNDDVPF